MPMLGDRDGFHREPKGSAKLSTGDPLPWTTAHTIGNLTDIRIDKEDLYNGNIQTTIQIRPV